MITIRGPAVRTWLAVQEARLRRALPVVAAELGAAGEWARWFAAALAREVRAARASRPATRPLVDSRGRRLRSSAYTYGPDASRSRRPPGQGPATGGYLPALLKVALVLVVTAGAFLGSSQAYIDFAADLPDAHSITATPLPEDTIIYAADGSQLADIHPAGVLHYYEPLSAMGKLLPQATISIEDSNFYHEPGIDPTATLRAAWIDWRSHKPVQGASTITQQLVKLRLTGGQVSFDRKIKEAILAVQVEHTYTKDQILEQYLNTVKYGNNAQGTSAASRIYFHKETKDLDLAQASMLAGIPQSPVYNNPFTNWAQAKNRQHDVLDAMVRNRYVTQEQADKAYAEDLSPKTGHMFTAGAQIKAAPGFTSWIIGQLRDRYGQNATFGGGLRVVTTLNTTLQAEAERAVIDNVHKNADHNVHQGAMTAIDPHTGAVVAMVGSADPGGYGGQYNMAVAVRNPGSSMKIWNYTAAIESGKFTMSTQIADSPISISQGPYSPPYRPENYDHRYHGVCQLQACMGNSLNVPAVKVELSTGIDHVVDVARRVGAPPLMPHADGTYTSDDPASSFGASLTLGGYGETTLQQATGAATLADMGLYHAPYGIASVRSSDGTEIFKADPSKSAKQVVDPKVAFIMQTIMSDNANRVMIFGPDSPLILPPRRVAAKTGTTDDFKDAWTVGFTPAIASAFWFGNPDNANLVGSNIDAVFIAAPAWHNFMNDALNSLKAPVDQWFGEPPGLQHATVGGRPVFLLPGTSANQPAPPLPSGASSSGAPRGRNEH